MNKIKEARLAASLTQAAMSEKMDIPKRTIQNWETDVNKCPAWAEKLIIAELERMGTNMSINNTRDKIIQNDIKAGGNAQDWINALDNVQLEKEFISWLEKGEVDIRGIHLKDMSNVTFARRKEAEEKFNNLKEQYFAEFMKSKQ